MTKLSGWPRLKSPSFWVAAVGSLWTPRGWPGQIGWVPEAQDASSWACDPTDKSVGPPDFDSLVDSRGGPARLPGCRRHKKPLHGRANCVKPGDDGEASCRYATQPTSRSGHPISIPLLIHGVARPDWPGARGTRRLFMGVRIVRN